MHARWSLLQKCSMGGGRCCSVIGRSATAKILSNLRTLCPKLAKNITRSDRPAAAYVCLCKYANSFKMHFVPRSSSASVRGSRSTKNEQIAKKHGNDKSTIQKLFARRTAPCMGFYSEWLVEETNRKKQLIRWQLRCGGSVLRRR
jgi:hypothetical protein